MLSNVALLALNHNKIIKYSERITNFKPFIGNITEKK